MNLNIIRRALDEAAKYAGPSEADDIRCALIDLEALTDAMRLHGLADWQEAEGFIADFKTLAAHAQTQPFDVVHNEDDEEGRVILSELTPGAFEEWLGELERLTR